MATKHPTSPRLRKKPRPVAREPYVGGVTTPKRAMPTSPRARTQPRYGFPGETTKLVSGSAPQSRTAPGQAVSAAAHARNAARKASPDGGSSRAAARRSALPAMAKRSAAASAPKGINLGKFASEVSSNYAKGVERVGGSVSRSLNSILPSRGASSTVPRALKTAPQARAGLKKALGR